ncbi:transmembrane 4 L six family member 20 [Phyllostomus discolor]|uniref:Transmembrane 4 L six family member 20 n=1 Tax=Phyllostomus discolor TaxID=89673 RepID=A0A6J2LAW3_9CHIR|nr:transmembrane 4 L6 family member 20 [Phyllostomus discolor]KAF6116586.1 transmembrane 4 L six family member 20 [Phyllostomus discolor]
MTCCEGWTSCNGFSLLVLLLLGVALNAVPLVVNRIDEGQFHHNPISCFEWWFPGIIGAGLMVVPATVASLAARKRACCNNRGGMFLSSFLNALTILGAVYCILVSAQALVKGPLICQSPDNSTASCEFSLDKLGMHPESLDLQWFTNGSCVLPNDPNSPSVNNGRNDTAPSGSKEERYKTIHFSVFVGLLLVGALELLFGLSQIVIGFLGCLCGVSKRRSRFV